ncbi:hypothetical protein HG530_011033 [Fusarium avenaceum]|nr:hypothetical protein HG530_011033 [Fusarium avenaceum]
MLFSKFQNLLCSDIDIAWKYCKNDSAIILDVSFDKLLHHHHIFFGGSLGSGTEDAWNVDDCEIVLVGSMDLDFEYILAEHCAITICNVGPQTHFLVRPLFT